MAKIKYVEDKKGVRIYPITTEQAVVDNNGITLDVKLANITGGMDIVELSSASGVLTDEQFELVQSDHCIVKYDGYNYYKYSDGETECVYNRVTETKGERTTTDYYFTCTLANKGYSFSTTVTPAGSPDAVKYVEQELTSEQKAQARENIGAGTYSKPVSGIPSSDLSSGVQSSLSNADSAYQKPASGIPASDLASGVIPDISGKQDTLVSGTNIKTINQNSLLGSGDITISSGEDGVGFETISTPQTADGTALITLTNGDTITLDLNHQHPQYPKYVLCDDEQEYEDITTKESDTLYLIKE